MTVGKPDFNLNSFGVKYLSKDEVQEFLNKKDKVDDSTGKYGGNSTVKPNADISPPYTPNLANPKMEQNPKGRGEHVLNVTNNEAPKIKPDANTKYVFNEPTYGIPNTRKQQTSGQGNTTGTIGTGTANDTRKLTGSAVGNVGNAPEGVKNIVQSKQGKRNVKVGVGAQAKEVFDATSGKGEKFYAKDRKEDNSIEGENRQNKKDEVTRGKKLKLTKLEQAKIALDEAEAREKKIKKPYVEGDKNTPEDIPTKGTDVEDDVSTQGEPNKPKFVPERPKTGTYDNIADNKETAKRKKEAEAKAAAAKLAKEKPIDWKKTHGARRQRVEEHRSERGLKNASNIIMDMAIMKLDLMKDLNTRNSETSEKTLPKTEAQEFQQQSTNARFGNIHDGLDYEDTPKTGSSPKGTGTSKQKLDTWQGGQEDSEYRKITNPQYTDDGKGLHDVQSLPKHKRGSPKVDPRMRKKDPIKIIPKTASETIFKAILLKLDLMKDVKSKRYNYTKLTSAGKKPAKKSPNASEALSAAYASGKMTENSVDADTNTETGATGKPKGSVADQYT